MSKESKSGGTGRSQTRGQAVVAALACCICGGNNSGISVGSVLFPIPFDTSRSAHLQCQQLAIKGDPAFCARYLVNICFYIRILK